MTNARIYADDAPFSCGDSLYYDHPTRYGYWWACALRGIDPDAPHGTRLSWWRRWQLRYICRTVGLEFDSI